MIRIKLSTLFIFLSPISSLADKVEQPLKGGSPRLLYPKIDTAYSPVFFGAGLLVGSWLAFKTAQKYIFPPKKRIISLKASASNKSTTGSTQKKLPSQALDSHLPHDATKAPGQIRAHPPSFFMNDSLEKINPFKKTGFKEIEKIVKIEDRAGRIIGLGNIRWITSFIPHCQDPNLRLPLHFCALAPLFIKK